MKLNRLVLLGAAVLTAFTLTACDDKKAAPQNTAAEKQYNIGVVQLVEHKALDEANKGFVDALAARGFKEGKNVKFDFQNAQADQSNLRNIAQRFTSNKVDLIGAIATPAAQTMANATKTTPIVATAVTDFEIAKLVKKNDKPGTNVTGSADMAPIDTLVELMLKIYPETKKVGTIYSSSEINSERQVQIFKDIAKAKNLEVKEATVSSVNDIQQAAQSLVGKVDAIYIPTDNTIASAVPALLKITETAKLPIFAGEGGMTKEGCFASVAIDYYELGKIAGNMAADILEGKSKPEDMAIQFQKEFKTLISESSLKNLGAKIPAGPNHEVVK
ncbi:ABC transporter substrate-binding protein [Turicimonas muris]|uniref:ABC transporter substrate-binding protein n=1 Tax=Turicimonas muris TaxID=1796652 RepID=UPI0026F3B790|nr:ABC transporter substrate-binding protein [Turicimonas muris]